MADNEAELMLEKFQKKSHMHYKKAIKKHPHLGEYMDKYEKETDKRPVFVNRLDNSFEYFKEPNIIYPVGDPIFVHISCKENEGIKYNAIEPHFSKKMKEKFEEVLGKILVLAGEEEDLDERAMDRDILLRLFQKAMKPALTFSFSKKKGNKEIKHDRAFNTIKYYFIRDIEGHSRLEPLIRDPYLEDIHAIGVESLFIVHKVFKMMETNIAFANEPELSYFLTSISERIGKPISDSTPIIDGALPDGSRLNMIFPKDVSMRGSSFTIRKFNANPLSFPFMIKFGTYSPMEAAYLWLCVENGMNTFVCGETASGKTTALNALLPFLDFNKKIYTCESSPECLPPHKAWQQMITRESGPVETQVDMMALLVAALRSRPDLIVIGEIRGAEGAVAFQAMQTGHPVLATFHASTVKSMVQRFTGDPINVPMSFMTNLNVAVMQSAVIREGRFLRRCLNINELVGFSTEEGKILTRMVFSWNAASDEHNFLGMNNSYILENVIAAHKGYADRRKIYVELKERSEIMRQMVERKIFDYHQVNTIYQNYRRNGLASLPFPVSID